MMTTTDARPQVASQLTALEALIVIGRTFAHLPAADFQIGNVYPDTIRISVHDDLDGFEQWRAALGITTDAVTYTARPHHMTLKAEGQFAGATIELVGFAPPLPTNGGEQ